MVTAAGALLRLVPMVGSDFPLNDGGLFLAMAEDLRANGFALPTSATYNDLGIPYAYPPLGFYLTAILETVGIGGLDVMRWVPLLASIATIPAAYAIGREVFRSDRMGVATAALFSVSTGSYEWLVQGGGITRAPGFLLALLAILLAIRTYRGAGGGMGARAGALLGATALWHPQAAVFAGLSAILFLPFYATDRRQAFVNLALLLGTAAFVVAPWVVAIVARHGIDPLVSAAGSGGTPLQGLPLMLSSRTSAGYVEVLGVATTVSLVVCAIRGFWLPPAWMLLIVLVDSRAGQPYVSVPAAMAISFLLRDVATVVRRHLATTEAAERSARTARRAGVAIGVVLVAAAFADSLAAQASVDSPLRALPRAERDAMDWVAEETDPDAAFVVVSGRFWALDAEAEWFPVIAERHSVATVQGYEWLGVDAFRRQLERSETLPNCVASDDELCIERWFADAGRVDYLFLTTSPVAAAAGLECCLQLAEKIAAFRSAETVYEDDGVAVVRLGESAGSAP